MIFCHDCGNFINPQSAGQDSYNSETGVAGLRQKIEDLRDHLDKHKVALYEIVILLDSSNIDQARAILKKLRTDD